MIQSLLSSPCTLNVSHPVINLILLVLFLLSFSLFVSLQTCFSLRDKAYNTWQSAEKSLANKKELEQKLQTTGKTEKIPQVQQEIKDVSN